MEAEEAILSIWMIRGGGESGDKAVASWFLQGDLDSEGLGRVVRDRLGVADMDPACARALLARIVGAGKDTLSEASLLQWLRRRFPSFQTRQMLGSVDFLTAIVNHLLGTTVVPDGLERLRSIRKDDVRGALRASVDEWTEVIWDIIEAYQRAMLRGPGGGGGNLKFAGDLGSRGGTFEGKFENRDVFDEGLERYIGLPHPKVLDAIINEHLRSANSTTRYKTSNYGLVCTPREEFECVMNPDPRKTYPGAGDGPGLREILPLRIYLSATGCLDPCKWEDEELKPVLYQIQDLCGGSLELSEQDRVHEALVMLMMALQGFASTAKQVKRSLKELEATGAPVSMAMLFEAVHKARGWSQATTESFIQRGRELYKEANLRPEEVICVRLYTGVHVGRNTFEAKLRLTPNVLLCLCFLS
jgi:hypothetical protein